MLLSCVLVVQTLCCHGMPIIPRQGKYGVDSVRGGLSHGVLTLCSQTSQKNFFSIYTLGSQGFGIDLGSVTSLQPWLHMTATEAEVSSFWEGSPWVGGQDSTSARRMSLGCATEIMPLRLLLCPKPVGMGMHSSFKITMQDLIAESHLSHGQQSPQTCLQLNVSGMSLGDLSADILTSHRTSVSLLMCSGKYDTRSPKQPLNHWATHQEHEGGGLSPAWRQMKAILAI